jgi:hypothetical protein
MIETTTCDFNNNMKTLYVSTDDGSLYKASHLDESDLNNENLFWKIEVPDVITLTPEQLCGGYGQIVEILIKAGVAKKKF